MTIVCTFLTFVEATSSFKNVSEKKCHFCMGMCYPLYLVGNNFYLNVLNKRRNVNGQQIRHAVRLWQRNLSFYVYFYFEPFFVYALFVIVFLLKVSYCTFDLSGLFYSLHSSCETNVSVWVRVCYMCVCVWGEGPLIFSMLLSLTRIDVSFSFYCNDLMLPNCLFFSSFFCLCISFPSQSTLTLVLFCMAADHVLT